MAGGGHSLRDGLKDPKRRAREREKEREKVKKGFFCTSERENKIFAEVPVGVILHRMDSGELLTLLGEVLLCSWVMVRL